MFMGFHEEQLTGIFIVVALLIGIALNPIDKINSRLKLFTPPLDSKIAGKSPLLFIKIQPIVVEVKGAIKHPGEYRVKSGSRYFDLIKLAGGLNAKADKGRIKKNYYLKNGQIFYVPFKKSISKVRSIIEVEIRGAIKRPGIYKLRGGSRFNKLLKKSGGLLATADQHRKYKNYYLKDGQTFYIRFK